MDIGNPHVWFLNTFNTFDYPGTTHIINVVGASIPQLFQLQTIPYYICNDWWATIKTHRN